MQLSGWRHIKEQLRGQRSETMPLPPQIGASGMPQEALPNLESSPLQVAVSLAHTKERASPVDAQTPSTQLRVKQSASVLQAVPPALSPQTLPQAWCPAPAKSSHTLICPARG